MTPEQAEVIDNAIDRAIAKYTHSLHTDCPFMSEDIVFIRTWRGRLEKAAQGVGMAIILAVVGGAMALITAGLTAWKGQH